MAHLSSWLDRQAADAAGLTADRIAEFLAVRRGSHVRLVSGRALVPMLGFLRGLGVAPPEPRPVSCTTVDRLVEAYRRYLADERGLVAGTVRPRERVARMFLTGLSEPVEEHLSRLDGAQVAAFVLRECPGAQRLGGAHGGERDPLAAAVPLPGGSPAPAPGHRGTRCGRLEHVRAAASGRPAAGSPADRLLRSGYRGGAARPGHPGPAVPARAARSGGGRPRTRRPRLAGPGGGDPREGT